ncbi:hypothetical protein DSECCO2_337110 [anaerobic digester metagenome]
MFEDELQMLKKLRKSLLQAEKEINKIDPIRELKNSYERQLGEKQEEINSLRMTVTRLEFENQRLLADKDSIWVK